VRVRALQVDWSDADIVFINNVLLSPETMLKVERRAKALQAGTRFVTYQPLVGSDFELAKELELSTSWGSNRATSKEATTSTAPELTSTYYYYRKVSPPSLEGDVEPAIRVCGLGGAPRP